MIKVLELFGGIGACTQAFKRLGIDYKVVDYVEIDKYAVASYNAINGTSFAPQDITQWDKDIDVDFIMHGSPCFVAGTKVDTINGYKNIEDIKVGDIVKSHDGSYNKVIETMNHLSDDIYRIEIPTIDYIFATGNHPFYIYKDNQYQWIEVKDIKIGDLVCFPNSDGKYTYQEVTSRIKTEFVTEVYNFEVENTHTYCVYGVAVHNCQDFSVAGLGKGGDENSGTRSSLMYESIRIINKLKPKYVLWENVKNLVSDKHRHNFDKYLMTLESFGYNNYYKVLNAKDYGIPQNRERVFTLSIRKDVDTNPWGYKFPKPIKLTKTLKDMLEDKVDEKYYLSSNMLSYLSGENQKESKFPRGERWLSQLETTNVKGVAATISTNAGNRPVDNFIIDDTEVEPTDKSWLSEKIKSFYDKNGYIPDVFNAWNEVDVGDVAPTLTTGAGNPGNRTGLCVKEEQPCNKAVVETLKDADIDSVKDVAYIDGYNRALKTDGITPTITTRVSASNNDFIIQRDTNLKQELCDSLIENNLVEEGDVIRHSYTNNRLDNGIENMGRIESKDKLSPTLDTRCDCLGVVVKVGNYSPSGHNAASIVDSDGIAPTVMENHGTVTATVVEDGVYTDLEKSLFTEDGNIKRYIDSDIVDEFKEGQLATTSFPNGYGHGTRVHNESTTLNASEVPSVKSNLRIRKLTPKECWRLMGFSDEAFEKASKVNSNAQLYKQAGNSIVVNVLESILKELYNSSEPKNICYTTQLF